MGWNFLHFLAILAHSEYAHTHIHTHTCGQMAEHGELCSTRICAKGYGHKWWAIRELHSAVWMKQVKWAQWTPVRATTEPQKFHWHSPNYKEAKATGTLSGCHINVSELAWSKRYIMWNIHTQHLFWVKTSIIYLKEILQLINSTAVFLIVKMCY